MTTFYIGPATQPNTYLQFDEVRITVGTARYTANYTPLATAFEGGAPPGPLIGTLDGTLPTLSTYMTQDLIYVVLPPVAAALRDDFIGGNLYAPSTVIDVFANKIGVVAASLPVPTASSLLIAGNVLDAPLPFVQPQLDAMLGVTGDVAVSLPTISFEAVGGVNVLDGSLPVVGCEASGHAATLGQLEGTLPRMESTALGGATLLATIDAALPRVRSELAGQVAVVGNIDAVLRTPRASVNALLGTSATLDAALALITSELNLLGTVTAQLTVTLPSMTSTATAQLPMAQVAVYITNTITSAVTTYEGFPLNSFAEINGKYYGAGPSGLVELVGDKDDTTDVDAVLALGKMHFGSEMQKRMSDFFIAMRSDGDITLRVSTDEGEPFEYTLSPLDIETLKQRRSLVGKGAKGKYWQFELANTGGCDFDFDSINAAAVVLNRRL